MRLTLRTLLAYLDQILEPADAQELRRKIEESEIATQLAQRIDRVLHEKPTEFADLFVTRQGGSANNVAEYLDNTMQPEHVAEFERGCLESDSHLAEVAACHQILTRVLGERADVPADLKQRLYALPNVESRKVPAGSETVTPLPTAPTTATPTHAATPAATYPVRIDRPGEFGVKSTPMDNPVLSSSQKDSASAPTGINKVSDGHSSINQTHAGVDADERWTTAPDYLKRPRRMLWQPLASALVIAILLALAALRGMGPLDRNHPLAKYAGLQADAVVANRSTEENDISTRQTLNDNVADNSGATTKANSTHTGTQDEASSESPSDGLSPSDVNSESGLSPSDTADEVVESADEALQSSPIDAAESQPTPSPQVTSAETAGPTASEPPNSSELTEDSTPAGMPLVNEAERTAPLPTATATDDTAASGSNEASAPQPPTDSVATADRSTAETPLAPEPPELINPLDPRPSPETTAPGATPEKVTDAGALGATEGVSAVPAPAATAPTAPVELGRFLNEQQVLLRFQPADSSWIRMAPGDRIQVGEQLMSLPTFRPPVVLASGIQVSLIGATRLEVLPSDDPNTPLFDVNYGRLSVATFTSAGTQLGIRWGENRLGQLTIDDMTTLALEVTHRYLPGADPDTADNSPYDVLVVYVTSGSAQWTHADAAPVEIPAGQRLILVNDRAPFLLPVDNLPTWIDGRDARPRDPMAAQDLATRMTSDRPALVVLRELVEDRHLELRSLAINSLAYLGELDPLLTGMSDAKLRSYWPVQYEVLVSRMNHGPESVQQVKSSLMQHYDEQVGEAMFRMLCGFSPQQLADGGANILIETLNHPTTELRYVANETLRSITGLPTLYQAHATDRQRRPAIAKWRTYQQQGKLAYSMPPELAQFLNNGPEEEESPAKP